MQNMFTSKLSDQDHVQKLIEKIAFKKKRYRTVIKLINENNANFQVYMKTMYEKYADYYFYETQKIINNESDSCSDMNSNSDIILNKNNYAVDDINTKILAKKIYKFLILKFHPDKNFTDNNDEPIITDFELPESNVASNPNCEIFTKIKKYFEKGNIFGLLKICQKSVPELPNEISINDMVLILESELYRIKKNNGNLNKRLDYLLLVNDHMELQKNEDMIASSQKNYVFRDAIDQRSKLYDVRRKHSDTKTNIEKIICDNERSLERLKEQLRVNQQRSDIVRSCKDRIITLNQDISVLEQKNTTLTSEVVELEKKIKLIDYAIDNLTKLKTRNEIVMMMAELNP